MRILSRLWPLALAIQLIACGGSGGTGGATGTSAATQPTAQDQTNAKAAALGASLNLSTGLATLSWTDTFAKTSGYAIQQQTDGSTWTTIDTVPGQGGGNQAITWSGTANVTETLRVQAVETNYNVSLLTQSGQSQVEITVPSTAPTIVLDQNEPVTGQLQISVSNASAYSSVTYFVDLLTLDTVMSGPTFPTNWNTTALTSGAHLIVAQLQVNADFSVQVRRSVQVANSEVAVSIAPVDPTIWNPPTIASGQTLLVEATSPAGIQSVTLSMDASPVGMLTAPNDETNGYAFQITGVSGIHAVNAVAIDNNGQSANISITLTIANPPQLSLSSPVDGGLVNGTLSIAGSVSSDKSGTVTTKATLGDLPVLNATTSSFSANFSLSGVVPGDYTLTVVSTDSTGAIATQSLTVTVTSSPALVYPSLGASGTILATDPTTVLFSTLGEKVHRLSGGSDTILTNQGETYSQWALSSGNAFALSPTSSQIDLTYWNTSGTSTDLGSVGSLNTDYLANLLAVHWPWALTMYWTVPPGAFLGTVTYTFFNAQTGQTVVPPLPEIAGITGKVDFLVSPTGLVLYYMTDLASNPGTNPIGINSWTQSSGQITSLATAAEWQLYPMTDGTRVAWQSGPVGSSMAPYSLVSYDIASSAQTTVSTTMSKFQLADGILAWAESGSNTTLIKASDGTTITTVSSLTSSYFYGTGGGYVLFSEASKLYVWSAIGGRQLILDAIPGSAVISGKTVYFTNGIQQLLYAVTLN